MDSHKNKYLKYKNKYLNYKNLLGGGKCDKIPPSIEKTPMQEMPQLCFGTVGENLEITLKNALEIGYRHIDCADIYTANYRESHGMFAISLFIKYILINFLIKIS